MRTKALLLGAIIGAASLASSMAQVYSVNIVGYINIPIPTGYTLIANQLDNSVNNNLSTLIPTPPNTVTVYKWNTASAGYDIATFDTDFQQWDNDFTLGPGDGFWVYNPPPPQGNPWTLTVVGQVRTGTQPVDLKTGFNLVSVVVPQEVDLDVTAQSNYTPSSTGDTVYTYDNATGSFNIYTFDADFQQWDSTPVKVKVGQGFFVNRTQPGTWSRTFNVSGN